MKFIYFVTFNFSGKDCQRIFSERARALEFVHSLKNQGWTGSIIPVPVEA